MHLIGIHDQIGRASAQAGLGVGEGIEGDGVQALSGHTPAGGDERGGARAARAVGASGFDEVTGIESSGGEG